MVTKSAQAFFPSQKIWSSCQLSDQQKVDICNASAYWSVIDWAVVSLVGNKGTKAAAKTITTTDNEGSEPVNLENEKTNT